MAALIYLIIFTLSQFYKLNAEIFYNNVTVSGRFQKAPDGGEYRNSLFELYVAETNRSELCPV